jgi:acyl carrier protein
MSPDAAYTPEEMIATVNRIMVEEFEAEEEQLKPEASLRKDLGLDSLDGVDLVIALELAFGFRIGEDEIRGIETLGDVYDRVRARFSE